MERRVVGIVADPDQSTDIAERIVEGLDRVLTASVSDKVDWDIQIQTVALPLDDYGKIIVWRDSDRIRSEQGWDMMICLTELTRRLERQLVISEVSVDHWAGVISLPALGPIRRHSHVCEAIVRVVREMLEDELQPERKPRRSLSPLKILPTTQSPERLHSINESGSKSSYLALKGFSGRVRLLLGMIRINRPWRMTRSLSGAIAAAAAAAAFGIFYSSIWSMADSLTPPRLLSISIIAIFSMVAWLIFYNNLWEKARRHRFGRDALLYNSATVATLTVGVSSMYVLLFIGSLAGSFIVIPGDYMQAQLQHPVTWAAYAQLAWLATSMGTMAGALGSSLESDEAILAATYGRREQERHARVTADDDDTPDSSKGSASDQDSNGGQPWR